MSNAKKKIMTFLLVGSIAASMTMGTLAAKPSMKGLVMPIGGSNLGGSGGLGGSGELGESGENGGNGGNNNGGNNNGGNNNGGNNNGGNNNGGNNNGGNNNGGNNNGGNSSSGNKGGGGGGKGWTNKNIGTDRVDAGYNYTTKNVVEKVTAGTVNVVTANTIVNSLNEAQKITPAGTIAYVTLNNVEVATTEVLAAMNNWVTENGQLALINFDTLSYKNSKNVQGRITLPMNYSSANDVSTVVKTEGKNVETIAARFAKYFTNNIQVVEFGQQGNFAAPVNIAAKLGDFTNTEALVLYHYNAETNEYLAFADNTYTIDENGYIHFVTSVGGYVVISENPLTVA